MSGKFNEIHGQVYFYNKLDFNPNDMLVYKTDPKMYLTTAYMDGLISSLTIYTGLKVCKNLYLLSVGLPWYPAYTLGYSLIVFIQCRYLMAEYLRQVFFIDEIRIVSESKIKVTTLINKSWNLLALTRLKIFDTTIAKEYEFDIKNCTFSD